MLRKIYLSIVILFISCASAMAQTAGAIKVLLKDKSNNNIEIIWYFTDIKKADGAITKDELTPIILENNKVTGIGWGYYEDYSKRKEINININ
jgi:hypothetical protein